MTALSVHLIHFPVHTLGPGVRVGLWCQGCSLRCRGCITPDSWEFRPDKAVSLDVLMSRISMFFEGGLRPDGITISGGEPFDQSAPLVELLRLLNGRGIADILIYSGYSLENLLGTFPFLPELAAAVVDGPFEEYGEGTSRGSGAWRGSDNQRLTLWREEFEERYLRWIEGSERRLQFVRGAEGKGFLVGIPDQRDASKLKNMDWERA